MIERTLSIIKPDGVAQGLVGRILSRFENNGLKLVAMRMLQLSLADAEDFYSVHRERDFFKPLTDFMSSGPVVVLCLEGEGAVLKLRSLAGATDPQKAVSGTIRADFASSTTVNTVHSSDSLENAKNEVAYFFRYI
jgi:nucleoside-diphosphate kinase